MDPRRACGRKTFAAGQHSLDLARKWLFRHILQRGKSSARSAALPYAC
jgi:hypothetical protein